MVSARRWFRHEAERPSPSAIPESQASGEAPSRPLRILLVNQYYWPDHASTAQHLTDLAESLAAQGHDCQVLTSQSRYKPGEPRSPRFEIHEGVSIHRVPATSLGRRGTLARMTDYLSFYAGAILRAMLIQRCDVVVTLTTPPIIGLIGTMLRLLKGSRHIYWSMDLHPDASLALGRMQIEHPVVRALLWLSSFVYRQADRVVVLGPYMAQRIAQKGVAPERIVTIPVWSRREEIYPIPRGTNRLRQSLGLNDAFVAMYSGNLGLAHSFDEFLAAARRLRHRSDILFLFVGDGPRLAEVKKAKAQEQLDNIRLLDYFPRDYLHVSLSLADVHLISMRPEMTGIVAPGKLYGVMAAGRPALFVGPEHCETADTIRDAGCGFTLEPRDADGLVQALERLAADPSLLRRMGERGRLAFLAGFERRLCCEHWNALIGDVTTSPVPAKSRSLAINRSGSMRPSKIKTALVLLGLITTSLTAPTRAEPPAASVAEIQIKHDRAFIRDLTGYLRDHPAATDRDQAYAALFNKAIEHDWFAETEELGKQYLRTQPDGPVKSLAQIVTTMARAHAGQFDEAIARFRELMQSLNQNDQEEFAASFSDSFATVAMAAGEYAVVRQVYETLLSRFGESPTLRQQVQKDIARLERVGKPAPNFAVDDLNGKAINLDAYRGKYVLLDFWATWCSPCIAELPRVQAAYKAYHDAGFDVIGVSLDESKPAVVDFVKARSLPWRQIHNGTAAADLAEAFGISSIPATYLIDPQGRVIKLDLRGPALDQVLSGLLERKAVASGDTLAPR